MEQTARTNASPHSLANPPVLLDRKPPAAAVMVQCLHVGHIDISLDCIFCPRLIGARLGDCDARLGRIITNDAG